MPTAQQIGPVALLDALPYPCWFVNLKDGTFTVNPAFKAHFEATTLQDLLNLLHPEGRDTFQSGLQQGKAFEVSFGAPAKPEEQTVHLQANPVREQGTLLGFLGTLDIKQAAAVDMQQILEHLPVGVGVIGLDGEVKAMNPALCELTGRNRDEVLGRKVKDISPQHLQVLQGVNAQVALTGQTLTPQEYQRGERHYRTLHFPVKDPSGTLVAVGHATLEVTEQKQAQHDLREQQWFLQRVTDEIPATVQLRDLTSGTMVFSNRYASAVIGYTGQEILDMTPEEVLGLFPEEDLPRILEVNSRVLRLQEGESLQDEYRVKHKDGSWRWIDARITIFERSADGTPLKSLLVGVDITERKHAESHLLQVQEQLLQVVEGHKRFVSEAAHEIKSPIAGIQGNLELLVRYPAMPPEEQQEVVGDAHREAVRLGRLVADLLSTARTGEGPMLLETRVRLDALLQDTLRDFEHQKGKHDLQVGEVAHCEVMGDPDRLKQLLIILISNALKYTPEDGRVRVGLQEVENQARLWVSDTGVGIPAGDLDKVFERHYRSKHQNFTDPGGTGLGLALAKWVVEEHRGKIWLESLEGQGTTVWVSLPVA